MEKVTQFLEKHVQWIVLGLAVLFAGYMAYSYVLGTPTSVQIAGRALAPGEINAQIYQGPVRAIEGDLNKGAPEMPVKDFVGTFDKKMALNTPEQIAAFAPLPPQHFPGAGNVSDDTNVVATQGGTIKQLPVPPVVDTLAVSSGRNTVSFPDPNAPKPNPGAAPVQPVLKTEDLDWVTVGGTIDQTKLAQAWAKSIGSANAGAASDAGAAGSTGVNSTRILRVELQREELMPNGTWGNQQTIPALKIYELKEFPAPNASEQVRLEYLDWASKNDAQLATPPFYSIAKGPAWFAPGTPAPAQSAAVSPAGIEGAAAFDPANPPKNRKLTPEEQKLVNEYNKMIADQKKAERDAAKPPKPPARPVRPGKGGAPMGPGARGSQSANPNVRFADASADDLRGAKVSFAQFQPTRGGNPEVTGGPVFSPGGEGGFGFSPGNQAGKVAGQGAIDVTTLTVPLQVWAHDETVVPGKTYRYRLRYSLLNPIHNVPNMGNPKSLEDILYMTSDWSAWTDKVVIDERVRFWLASNPTSVREAKFEVFTWKDGGWKKEDQKASPGDPIPGTSWMLVDLRQSSRGGGMYDVLLVHNNGTTERRNPVRDHDDPDHLRLQEQAASAAMAQ